MFDDPGRARRSRCAFAPAQMERHRTRVLSGYRLVTAFDGALPFLLAAAGGAMLYVISDEMIPETHSHGYEKPATFALIAGFLLVLVLQSAIA